MKVMNKQMDSLKWTAEMAQDSGVGLADECSKLGSKF